MRFRVIVALFLFAASLGPAHAASQPSFVLPFELIDNRVFVDVTLNGRGPFHFILDTGAEGSLSSLTAKRLGVKVEDGGEGQGVGQATVHFGQTRIGTFQLGDLKLNNVDFSVSPLDDSPQVFGNKPLDGVIGLEVFKRMVVKFDYARRTLTFTAPESFAYSGTGSIVPFERPEQIPIIAAKLDGVAGKFGVDTGARSALLLFGPFSANNKLAEKYGAKLEGVTGWGVGGPVRSLLARADELSFGDVTVQGPVIRLSTQKAGLTTLSNMAGLIGPDVLAQFDITFDYARNRIIFEKNTNYGRHDAYDRAGVWMGQKGENFTAVDVIPGGPAYDAGLRTGDTILAIDGVRTGKLVLPDVREQMRVYPMTASEVERLCSPSF